MTPATRALLDRDTFNPYRLPNNAAVYSVQGTPGDSTYILSSGNCVLVADRSGNSAVNGLVLNGSSGNYASTPDSAALSVTGELEMVARVMCVDFSNGGAQIIISKRSGSSGEYLWRFESNAQISLTWYEAGVEKATLTSTTPTLSDLTTYWFRVTRQFSGGTATVKFYYAEDTATNTPPSSWSQIGTDQTASSTIATDTALAVGVGAQADNSNHLTGIIYRALIYTGIGGTLAFDANFAAQPKLATSFTDGSTPGGTVTINSSGDLGARICGARDRVQLTASKQPAFSTGADGINILTYDGSNDYMKSAPFSLSQPESRYWTGSQETWTDTDCVLDGNVVSGTPLYQRTTTNGFRLLAGGAATTANTDLGVATRGVVAAVLNSTASSVRVNRMAAVGSGTAIGTNNSNGVTVGAYGDGTGPGNITEAAYLVRSAADDAALKDRITDYFIRAMKVSA